MHAMDRPAMEDTVDKWKVRGFCEDEQGERISLGAVVVEAKDKQGAEHAAWEELWDGRLTAASCRFVALIEPADEVCAFCGEEAELVICDHCGSDEVCQSCHEDDQCCDGDKG